MELSNWASPLLPPPPPTSASPVSYMGEEEEGVREEELRLVYETGELRRNWDVRPPVKDPDGGLAEVRGVPVTDHRPGY